MDSREKALETIKEQIRQQRARIDPAVLKKAQKAAAGKNLNDLQKQEAAVPYDKKSAQKAIELFLLGHADKEEFARKLSLFLSDKN